MLDILKEKTREMIYKRGSSPSLLSLSLFKYQFHFLLHSTTINVVLPFSLSLLFVSSLLLSSPEALTDELSLNIDSPLRNVITGKRMEESSSSSSFSLLKRVGNSSPGYIRVGSLQQLFLSALRILQVFSWSSSFSMVLM